MENKKIIFTDILLIIASAVLALGAAFVFHACGPKDDGSFMSCHWAQQAVFGLGLVMMIISCMHLGAKNPRMKMGISLAIIPVAVYTALVPQFVIKLCMMSSMRCHTTMRPAAAVICVLIVVIAAVDVILQRKQIAAR